MNIGRDRHVARISNGESAQDSPAGWLRRQDSRSLFAGRIYLEVGRFSAGCPVNESQCSRMMTPP